MTRTARIHSLQAWPARSRFHRIALVWSGRLLDLASGSAIGAVDVGAREGGRGKGVSFGLRSSGSLGFRGGV